MKSLFLKQRLLFIGLAGLCMVCKSYGADPQVSSFFQQTAHTNQIKIVSLNTLNLYDTTHDNGYFDYTFLPTSHPEKAKACRKVKSEYYRNLCLKLNWNRRKLNKKMAQIKKVLVRHGSLPDILALQEVENRKVIAKLAKFLGYTKFIVTDQPSKRGIDVALLWNPKKVQYVDHIEVPAVLRDPLRVEFQLANSGSPLFVYVNHWPAQSAPSHWRVNVAKAVKKDLNRVMKGLPDAKVIMVGDYNVTRSEESEVFTKQLTGSKLKNPMLDLHKLSKKLYPKNHSKLPEGTYWFGGTRWNRFDRILVNENLVDSHTHVDISSYRILYSKLITGVSKVTGKGGKTVNIRHPLSYNFLETKGKPLGYSDHLPVSVIIND